MSFTKAQLKQIQAIVGNTNGGNTNGGNTNPPKEKCMGLKLNGLSVQTTQGAVKVSGVLSKGETDAVYHQTSATHKMFVAAGKVGGTEEEKLNSLLVARRMQTVISDRMYDLHADAVLKGENPQKTINCVNAVADMFDSTAPRRALPPSKQENKTRTLTFAPLK